MEGIEKIAAKIAQDAQAEIQKLMAETDQKVKAIQEDAQRSWNGAGAPPASGSSG